MIYFRSVAARANKEAYSAQVFSTQLNELALEVLQHNHSLAKICSTKYRFLTIASYSGAFGLSLGLFLLIIRG
jgi:hypothetical protein